MNAVIRPLLVGVTMARRPPKRTARPKERVRVNFQCFTWWPIQAKSKAPLTRPMFEGSVSIKASLIDDAGVV